MEYYLIGYFPKQRVTRENWQTRHPEVDFPAPASVLRICSVSYCIVHGPTSFDYPDISQNCFNQYGGFNRLADAEHAMSASGANELELYAYAIPECIFMDGQPLGVELGCVDPEAFDDHQQEFELLGYDVVEIQTCNLGHSPLSCNGQATRYESLINACCLVGREEDAQELARSFSIDKPEPGDYCVVQVWLRRASLPAR